MHDHTLGHMNPCPEGYKIYNVDRIFFGLNYYIILNLSRVDKTIFIVLNYINFTLSTPMSHCGGGHKIFQLYVSFPNRCYKYQFDKDRPSIVLEEMLMNHACHAWILHNTTQWMSTLGIMLLK